MARYRVAEGRVLSHSERVEAEIPTRPPRYVTGYEGRTYEAGDELELPENEGRRLVEAGVLEEVRPKKSNKKRK